MAESLGRKGLRLVQSAGTDGFEGIRAATLKATGNLLFFYWRRPTTEKRIVLVVFISPNSSGLEAARASVTVHTLSAALPVRVYLNETPWRTKFTVDS